MNAFKESFAKLSGRPLEDALKLDAENFSGKNLFVEGAVIGVCAENF